MKKIAISARRGRTSRWGLCLCLCLLCGGAVYAQEGDRNKKAAPSLKTETESGLRLTTTILEQKYCSRHTLCFTLRLDFTNLSAQPLILYKDSSVIGRYMVSNDLKHAAARKYKLDVTPTYSPLVLGLHFEPPSDESLFVVLKAGESYQLEKAFNLPFVDPGGEGGRDDLRPGNYVLQIVVQTWYYPSEVKDKVREQWSQKGLLWTDPVMSLPMMFEVENIG